LAVRNFLVRKFPFTNAKFGAKNATFWENLVAKLAFLATFSEISSVYRKIATFLPRSLFPTHDVAELGDAVFCRVWNVEAMRPSACKVLPHPSFVYAAKYHTDIRKLVVTGGFDRLLRVWNLESEGSTACVCTSLLFCFVPHWLLIVLHGTFACYC